MSGIIPIIEAETMVTIDVGIITEEREIILSFNLLKSLIFFVSSFLDSSPLYTSSILKSSFASFFNSETL